MGVTVEHAESHKSDPPPTRLLSGNGAREALRLAVGLRRHSYMQSLLLEKLSQSFTLFKGCSQ